MAPTTLDHKARYMPMPFLRGYTSIYTPFQSKFDFVLEVLGTVGLILIVLDGALGLRLLKNKVLVI